jgi:hypothetical protein
MRHFRVTFWSALLVLGMTPLASAGQSVDLIIAPPDPAPGGSLLFYNGNQIVAPPIGESGALGPYTGLNLIGTDLNVVSASSGANSIALNNAFLDFGTLNNPSLYILNGVLSTSAGTPPLVQGMPGSTAATLVQTVNGYQLFMTFSKVYLQPLLATELGVSGGFAYNGSLTLNIREFNSSLAGAQVSSGNLLLNAIVPEPASLILGSLGLGSVALVTVRRRKALAATA